MPARELVRPGRCAAAGPGQDREGGGDAVDARSILLVLGLDARGGDQVVLSAEGDGADQALDELATLVATDHDAQAA